MDRENPFSCTYDSGKLLIETFGRGNLARYLEPNLSERNNFERQKMARQLQQHPRLPQTHIKNTPTIKTKMTGLDSSNGQKDRQPRVGAKEAANFEEIDEISEKINGLIRSISISCQKRGMSSKKQLARCDTAQKLHQLQSKYSNNVSQRGHKSIDRKHQLKRRQDSKAKAQPNLFRQSFASEIVHNKNARMNQAENSGVRELEESEYYDDINERIQHISDKITRYEKKMEGYQEIYKNNKKNNELYLKDWSQLKELKLHQANKQKEVKSDKTAQKGLFIKKEAEKNTKGKQGNAQKENNYQPFSKKQGYFNEKFKELSKPSKRDVLPAAVADKKSSQHERPKDKLANQKASLQSHHCQKFQGELNNKSTFLKALIKQIALDQDFRHAKHMFGGVQDLFGQGGQNNNKKWVKLKDHLEAQGLSFSIGEVKQTFMPKDDQIDPFMSVSHSHEELVHGVIFAYQACEAHWRENIYHNWTFRELKQANFTGESLDRGKKGFISLEDLTFYINTELDGLYRNRDLLLIYNRLSSKQPQKKIKYKQIVDNLLTS